jgi:hypothetical protein
MASMTVEIVTTRDIARQILRHRSFSFQEFSQRYAAMLAPPVLREARLQDQTNRQNSIDCESTENVTWWEDAQRRVASASADVYLQALDRGIAKEVARSVLPEGMTESVLYMAGASGAGSTTASCAPRRARRRSTASWLKRVVVSLPSRSPRCSHDRPPRAAPHRSSEAHRWQ